MNLTPEELAQQMKANPDLGIQQGATSLRVGQKLGVGGTIMGKDEGLDTRTSKTKRRGSQDSLRIKESDWQRTVIEYAHLRGWRVAHFRPGKTSRTYTNKRGEIKYVWVTPVQADGKGFFDLVLVRPPRIMFIELKSDKGKLTKEQENWCRLIANTQSENNCISWGVWRPADWEIVKRILDKKIEEV